VGSLEGHCASVEAMLLSEARGPMTFSFFSCFLCPDQSHFAGNA